MSATTPPEQQRVPRSSPLLTDEIEVLGNGTGPDAGDIEKPPLEDEGVVMRSPFDDMSFVRTFKVFWKAELIAFIAAFSAAAEHLGWVWRQCARLRRAPSAELTPSSVVTRSS
jgi:hypothetical protein